MSDESVVAVYDTVSKLREAAQRLQTAGFPRRRISVIAHNLEDRRELHPYLEHGDVSLRRLAVGAIVGAVVGVVLGSMLYWMPDFRPYLAATLIGSGLLGMIVGGLIGAMVGWGVPRNQVGEYEEKLEQGKLLLIARGEPKSLAVAQRTLEETEPEELHFHAATSDEAPEVYDENQAGQA